TTTPAQRQGGYAVVNLSSSYQFSKQVEVSASVVNLFDKSYTDSSANNPQSVSYAMPRAVTVSLRSRF
ncbi:MAG: TonB-dependent receptor, partial [Rhizobacter sp.]|nr:TonB-dependent receptor [Rhizobacter sp.]